MNFQKLDAYMDYLTSVGYHGASLIVAKDGETVYSKSVGFKDVDNKIPASVDDQYWIFSCSKVLVCIAAMTLVEQGKLKMQDPVSKYLPEYADVKVLENGVLRAPKTTMTIEHLFTMTGGLTYDLTTKNILEALKKENANTREIVAAIAKDPLVFDPGTKYQYSLCHDVLAAVMEVVTGESVEAYMKRVMFDPLHMNKTTFHPDEETKKNMAPLFMFDRSDYTSHVCESQVNPYRFNETYESGGAGICTNARDYIEVLKALSIGGTAKNGYQLLKPETVAELSKNRLSKGAMGTFFDTRLFGYGWGYCGRCHIDAKLSNSKTSIGEFGWDGAANDFALVDPNKHIALFFSTGLHGCNFGYHSVHYRLRDLAIECACEE